MRFLPLVFLLLLTTTCGSPDSAAPPPPPPPPAVTPTDEQMTGDPAIDNVRMEANRIDAQFQAGMLQQKNVAYACDKIRGLVELHTEKGKTVLAWELDGTMRTLSNNSEVPGVRNTTAQYRYYVADGAVFKFLKRKYDHYTYATDNPNPDTLPLEEMTPGKELPFRYGLAKSALETGAGSFSKFGCRLSVVGCRLSAVGWEIFWIR